MKKVAYKRVPLILILIISGGFISCAEKYKPQNSLKAEYQIFIKDVKTRTEVTAFFRFLEKRGLANVVDFKQLLRQGTDWRKVREPAYALPPRKYWPKILLTLQVLKNEIVPIVGELEVVSGFRTHRYNRRAGGARSSRHMIFGALDIIPKNNITRGELHKRLLKIWRIKGRQYKLGLGLYSRTRFHVDTVRYRRW